MLNREKLVEVFGNHYPQRVGRVITRSDFEQWCSENIGGPVVIRCYDARIVTIYLPECSPEGMRIYEEELQRNIAVFLTVRFEQGWLKYLWHKLMCWIRGH